MDEEDAKLYWVESEGSAYTFMKSNLDGSDAERVCGGEKNTPFDLVISGGWLYWSEWHNNAVWKLAKASAGSGDGTCEPERLFVSGSKRPMGLALTARTKATCQKASSEFVAIDHGHSPLASAKSVLPAECVNFCLNDGQCSLTTLKIPVCSCQPSGQFAGERCEVDLCQNFCLNDGDCHISAVSRSQMCECAEGFYGSRCQLSNST